MDKAVPVMFESEIEVLDALGKVAPLASRLRVSDGAVSHWRKDGIPPARWLELVGIAETAVRSGHPNAGNLAGVDLRLMAELHRVRLLQRAADAALAETRERQSLRLADPAPT